MKFENRHSIIGKLNIELLKKTTKFLLFSLMPSRALSHDGKKHVITVPVRLRKLQTIEPPPIHEGSFLFLRIIFKKNDPFCYSLDCHFTAASLRHVKDLAGIFGNDCVFYLTQDTKAKISIGRPSAKGQAPLIMHMDYEMSSVESQTTSTATRHQLTPW
jgi:hypothetical protein